MKISSPYKDYYDHLQGVIGQDPLAYYERVPDPVCEHYGPYIGSLEPKRPVCVQSENFKFLRTTPGRSPIKFDLHLCDREYSFFMSVVDGLIYHPPMIEWDYKKPGQLYDLVSHWPSDVLQLVKPNHVGGVKYGGWTPTQVNVEKCCPIVLEANLPIVHQYGKRTFVSHSVDLVTIKNPRLADLGIQKVLSAEDAYHLITGWLLSQKEPPAPKPVADKTKILSHGMDPKTSFRPKMK